MVETDPRSGESRDEGPRIRRGVRGVHPAWVVLPLIVAAGLAFAPGLQGNFVRDDELLILHNRFARDPAHLPHVLRSPFWDVSSLDGVGRATYLNLYRPVISVAYISQFMLFGESAVGFHVVSLLLHIACIGLAFVWVRERLGDATRAGYIAAAVGLVPFALHPAQTEVVSWISGCTDLWMTFWLLLGLLALKRDRTTVRAAGAVCFLLAFLSKESAIVAPLFLTADAWLREGRRPRLRREGWAWVGTGIGVAAHVLAVPPQFVEPVSASGSAVTRVLATLGHFMVRVAWPFDPSVEPVPWVRTASGELTFAWWAIAIGAASIVALVALAALVTRPGSAGRAARSRWGPWAADALLFLLPLGPVLNVLSMEGDTVVADRYLYLPLIALSSALGRLALAALRPHAARRAQAALVITAVLVAGVLSLTSSVYATHFRSTQELWIHELARNPRSYTAISNAVDVAARTGHHEQAITLAVEGAGFAREDHQSDRALDLYLTALSLRLTTTSDADQATLTELRRAYDRLVAEPYLRVDAGALAIDYRFDREMWERAYRGSKDLILPRATAYLRTGEADAAENQLRAFTRQTTRHDGAWILLARAHALQDEWHAAHAAALMAERAAPEQPRVAALRRTLAEAQATANRRTTPGPARALRDAEVGLRLGAPERARRVLDAALAETPSHLGLWLARVRTDVADGRFDLARETVERARVHTPERDADWDSALSSLDEGEAAAAERARVAGSSDP